MNVIKADHHRLLRLEGVPEPVSRPVDIDQSHTGFTALRSLRIYRFTNGSVIDGHAEDDEVLIVVLAGSVHLQMSEREVAESSPEFVLSAVGDSHSRACAAYLPPNGAYRLTPRSDAEVAYARATPTTGRAPAVFSGSAASSDAGSVVLFDEATYAQRLRLRVVQVMASHDSVAVMPLKPSESSLEALVHVKAEPADGAITLSGEGLEHAALESWDTVSVLPGERLDFRIAPASWALLLIVLASA